MEAGELPNTSQDIAKAFQVERMSELAKRKDSNWILNNPPTIENLQNSQWWIQAREKVVGLSPKDTGGTFCKLWVKGMFEIIARDTLAMAIPGVKAKLIYSPTDDHWWIELDIEDSYKGLYDGTAGQKTGKRKHHQGLYGSKPKIFKSLSEGIIAMYDSGQIIDEYNSPHSK